MTAAAFDRLHVMPGGLVGVVEPRTVLGRPMWVGELRTRDNRPVLAWASGATTVEGRPSRRGMAHRVAPVTFASTPEEVLAALTERANAIEARKVPR